MRHQNENSCKAPPGRYVQIRNPLQKSAYLDNLQKISLRKPREPTLRHADAIQRKDVVLQHLGVEFYSQGCRMEKKLVSIKMSLMHYCKKHEFTWLDVFGIELLKAANKFKPLLVFPLYKG